MSRHLHTAGQECGEGHVTRTVLGKQGRVNTEGKEV
jgi:hypothetical protein